MSGPGPHAPPPERMFYIGVGSNVEPRRNILRGVALLRERVRLEASSPFYRNPAVHRHRAPDTLPPFINGVLRAGTALPPDQVVSRLLRAVEKACGRVRTRDRDAPRPLDLDLLAVEGLCLRAGTLRLPDPEIARYPFVALPLAQLAPHLVPVGSQWTVGEIVRGMEVTGFRVEASLTRAVRRLIARGGGQPAAAPLERGRRRGS